MDRNYFESQWENTKAIIQNKWNKLTDEDIRYINGRFDNLIDRLELRYGWTEEQAEDAVRRATFERAGYATERDLRKEKEGSSDLLKWALALCLPLLFAGLWYAGSHRNQEVVPQPKAVVEEVAVITETPGDQTVAQLIRQAIAARAPLFQDLRTLRVSAANGVVTITGSVANPQERDTIVNLIRNIPGVTQVNDNITIRQ